MQRFCKRYAKITLTLTLMVSLVVLSMIPLMSNVSAQSQCGSELAGIVHTYRVGTREIEAGTKFLLDPSFGIRAELPPNWDSFHLSGGGYRFVPCENPSVEFDIVSLSLPTDMTADQFLRRVANDIITQLGLQGHRLTGSGYLNGTSDYSMMFAVEGSNTRSHWIILSPIDAVGYLYISTFRADSPTLFLQYSGQARGIYDNWRPVNQEIANQFMSMFARTAQLEDWVRGYTSGLMYDSTHGVFCKMLDADTSGTPYEEQREERLCKERFNID